MKWYAGLQTVIKTGIYHRRAIRDSRARGHLDQNASSLMLDFAVCAQNLHRAVGVSHGDGGGGVSMTRKQGRGEGEGAAFTGLYLLHKFLFDPTGDGFPSFGLWMSRDRGNRVLFCLHPPPLYSAFPSPSELLLCEDFLDRGGIPVSL